MMLRLDRLMGQPYSRVIVMHIAIIAGGFITMSLGSLVGVLIMLIILNTIIDIKLHLRQRISKNTFAPPLVAA